MTTPAKPIARLAQRDHGTRSLSTGIASAATSSGEEK
jgi:hypothetical protein